MKSCRGLRWFLSSTWNRFNFLLGLWVLNTTCTSQLPKIVVVQSLSHTPPLSLWTHGLQHAKFLYPPPSPGTCSNSCPWLGNAICLILCCPLLLLPQSFPTSGSFPVSQLFASDGQRIGASASAPVLPMNNQSWFPLGLTDLISLQPKGLSRVFSSTTIQKYQFFDPQPSLWYSSHNCMWLFS